MTTRFVFNPLTGQLDVAAVSGSPPLPDPLQVVAFDRTSGILVLQAVSAGMVFELATIDVDVAFDDAAAMVGIGTTTTPTLFLGMASLAAVGQIVAVGFVPITIPDVLILTVSPGASTQGSGALYYRIYA